MCPTDLRLGLILCLMGLAWCPKGLWMYLVVAGLPLCLRLLLGQGWPLGL